MGGWGWTEGGGGQRGCVREDVGERKKTQGENESEEAHGTRAGSGQRQRVMATHCPPVGVCINDLRLNLENSFHKYI